MRTVIWPNLTITFAPKSVKHGSIVFKIKNRDNHPHRFAINGVTSPPIKPHASAEMTVKFKKPSSYAFTVPDAPGWTGVGGQLRVT